MYLLDKEQAAKVDEVSINDFGIDGIVLMENAGAKTADWIDDIINQSAVGASLCACPCYIPQIESSIQTR